MSERTAQTREIPKRLFERADIRVALCLFVCICSVYLLVMNGHIRSDGLYHYIAALNLIRGKTPVVEDPRYVDHRTPLDVRGERTVQYGVGWTATLVPVVAVCNLFCARLGLPGDNKLLRIVVSSSTSFVSAATAALLYLVLRKLGYRRRTCIITAFLLAFSTMLWTYSRGDLWTEPVTALAITAALLAAVQHRESGSTASAFLSGFFVAYLLTIKIFWLFLIVPFVVFLFWNRPHRAARNIGAFLLPFVGAFAAMCLYNKLRFGVFIAEGYLGGALTLESVRSAMRGQPVVSGLYRLLLSPGKSVLLFNPPVFMALFGARQFWRDSRPLALFCLVVLGGYVLFFASRPVLKGSYVWGPRHLTSLLPIMMLPLAHLIGKGGAKPGSVRILLVVILVAGILIQFPNLFLYPKMITITMFHEGVLNEDELYYVAERCPIVRNWILLKNSLLNLVTGEPLFFYPTRIVEGNVELLRPVYLPDFVDVWDSWINIVRRAGYMDVLIVKVAVFTITALLVCAAIAAGIGIGRTLRVAPD